MNPRYYIVVTTFYVDREVLNVEAINALALLEDVCSTKIMTTKLTFQIKLQQLLWSGSIPMLHNPRLFTSLKVIGYIYTYNKIFIPTAVFDFNWKSPLKTKCELPLFETNSNRNETIDEDEDAKDIMAPQLALTRRFLYQAFKFRAAEVAEVCESLGTAVRLQTTSKQDLFQPLYPSKSMMMAASLLNSLFETLLNSMKVSVRHHKAVFEAMTQDKEFTLGNVKCSKAKRVLTRYLETCFPMDDSLLAKVIKEQTFYSRWLEVLHSFGTLNRYVKNEILASHSHLLTHELSEMHFAFYQNTDDKQGESYPVLPGITAADVHNQMLILLFTSKVQWVPALANTTLVAKNNNYFILDHIVPQFYSTLLASSVG